MVCRTCKLTIFSKTRILTQLCSENWNLAKHSAYKSEATSAIKYEHTLSVLRDSRVHEHGIVQLFGEIWDKLAKWLKLSFKPFTYVIESSRIITEDGVSWQMETLIGEGGEDRLEIRMQNIIGLLSGEFDQKCDLAKVTWDSLHMFKVHIFWSEVTLLFITNVII